VTSGKRHQAARQANANAMLAWANRTDVMLSSALLDGIHAGFSPAPDGEDRFDAVIGLFGMLNVVLGYRESGEPEDEQIRSIEGWILGQDSTAPLRPAGSHQKL
jgi:hypothetical protein